MRELAATERENEIIELESQGPDVVRLGVARRRVSRFKLFLLELHPRIRSQTAESG
jgi:hypothetical protein